MALACRLLRSPLLVPSCCTLPFRTVAMSVPRLQMEEAVEQLKSKNPFYEKYAAKMATLKEKAPEEFLEKVTKVVQPPAPVKHTDKPR